MLVQLNNNTAGIRSCQWSEPFCQRDMTTAYRCLHSSVLAEFAKAKGEFVNCFCLGLVEWCPYYEEAAQ